MGWAAPLAPVGLIAAVGTAVGLSPSGWAVGLACGLVTSGAVARGSVRSSHVLGPADQVTLTRAWLACAVAALVADGFVHETSVSTLVALSTAGLVLDAVDGWVARRTDTSSRFGARFDGEVDAFLILVLSVFVARSFGGWVLAIGAARYVFGLAGWVWPWMREQLPPRYWRKVVAATQGIVLTVVAAGVVPRGGAYAVLAVASALLAESFGRDVMWLWRRRPEPVRATRSTSPPASTTVRGTHAAT